MRREQRQRLEKLKRELQAQEKRAEIPKNPVDFFRKILRLKPYPYQADFLQDPSPLKVIRWCRRAGKTTVMSGDDIHFAMLNPNSTVLVIMPKFQQTKEIYFQGEGGLHWHLSRMDREVYKQEVSEELQTIIRFRNKSRILAEVPDPFTVRGHGPKKLSLDEMSFIRKDRDLWLSALLPMTLTGVVKISVASTPWNKDSIYSQMCFDRSFRIFSGNVWHDVPEDAKEPGQAKYLKVYGDVLKPKGPLDPQQVEAMREQYAGDPWRWKREMECSFVDDETAFLPSSLIIKCQNDQLEFARFEDLVRGDLYGGWDLGKERDHGVFAAVNKVEDVCRLIHCKQFPLGTPYVSQMAYIKSLCDRWQRFHAISYDKTGALGMDEEIQRAGLAGAQGIVFTKPSKHGMATLLKERMMAPRKADASLPPEDQRRQFELPYDMDVQAELNIVQWKQTPGSEVYTFSSPEGSHDDRFWAICLAVTAAVETPPPSRPISRSLG